MIKYTTNVHTFEDMHTKKDCYVFASEVFTIVTARETPYNLNCAPHFGHYARLIQNDTLSCTLGL